MMRRKVCNLLAALFSMTIIFPLVFMTLDRQVPVIIENGSISPAIVDGGGTVTVSWTLKVRREIGSGMFQCDGTFIRRIIDAGGFVIDSKPHQISSPDSMNKSEEVVMPTMLPGPATYQIIVTYWCNPVQKYLFPIIHHEEIMKFTFREAVAKTGKTGETGATGPAGPQGQRGVAGQDR